MKVMNIETEYLRDRFYVMHSCTAKQVRQKTKKLFKIDVKYSDSAMGHTYSLASGARRAIIIWINNKEYKSVAETISTAYHESGHAVFFMLEYAGIDPQDSSGEHFLYLQDYITQKILESINKHETGKRKKTKKRKELLKRRRKQKK